MLRFYFHLTIRNLQKRRFYTMLNVLGLMVGFIAFALIILYVRDELSYDKFHDKSERIFRVWDETTTRKVAITPYVWGQYIMEDFPEVENYVNILQLNIIVRKGTAVFNESSAYAVDSTFFEIFDFPVISGERSHLVDGTNQIVLTPASAEKYFGAEDPVGQFLEINLFGKIETFTVSGVVSCPGNSHLQFDFLLPFPLVKKHSFSPGSYTNWSIHFIYSYLLLHEGARVESVIEKFDDFLLKHGGESLSKAYTVSLEPLESIYLESKLEFDFTPRGNLQYVNILTLVAFVILGIAIINFINLSTAQSLKRAREVSVRKIFGSGRSSVVSQFILEAVMISMIAMILAIGAIFILLPAYNGFTGKSFEFLHLIGGVNILFATVTILMTGLLSGLYPALVLSSFQPVKVFYARVAGSGKSAMARKVLVIFQFGMTIILLIGTGIIYYQVKFMRSKDLGFNKEQVLVISDAGRVSAQYRLMERLKQEIKSEEVLSISASSSAPGIQSWSTRFVPEGWDSEDNISLSTIFADEEYLETYQIELVDGRDFDPLIQSDSTSGFLINEAAQKLFASYDSTWMTNPVGKSITWTWKNKPGHVVGVFKDFHFESLQRSINPLIIHTWPEYYFTVQMRLNTHRLSETVSEIEQTWNTLFPNIPFEYEFASQAFEDHIQNDQRLGDLFMLFSFVSVVVAVLGLLGLSSFMAQDKAREMSIRKVIGATEQQLTVMISVKFVRLVLIGNLLAMPLAYFFMDNWLDDFANRIGMPLIVFVAALIFTVIVALTTTSYHALKAARSNPASVLNRE